MRTLDTTDDMMDAGFWAATWWPTRDLLFIPATLKKPAKLVRASDGRVVASLGTVHSILMSPSGKLAWCRKGNGNVTCQIDGLTLVTLRKDNSLPRRLVGVDERSCYLCAISISNQCG